MKKITKSQFGKPLITVAVISLALLSACGPQARSLMPADAMTADDRPTVTGGVTPDNKPYTTYNPPDQTQDIKSSVPATDDNKLFADQIERAWMTTAPAEGGTQPVRVTVHWKSLQNPLVFDGNLQQQGSAYVGQLHDSSGQRTDLSVTAQCVEATCYHSKFIIQDQQNRTAAIVITKEDRTLRLKTPADTALAPTDDKAASDYRSGKPVVVTSTEIYPGRSYYDISEKTADPKEKGLHLSGDLAEPGGDCVPVVNDQPQFGKTCLIGNDEKGDLLFKLQIKDDSPSASSTGGAKGTRNTKGSDAAPQPPAPKKAIYLELARDQVPAENVPTTTTQIPVSKANCPISTASNSPVIQDIMRDCGNSDVEHYTKMWATGTRGKWMKNFLHYNQLRLQSHPSGSSAELSKAQDLATMISVLVKNNFPEVWTIIALHESAGFINQTKPAPAGEIGYWQLRPETAAGFGLKVYPKVTRAKDERLNVAKATATAVRYYNGLLTMWGGDVKMAIASYNRGEGTMDKASKNLKLQIENGHIDVGDDLREAAAISKDFWYIYHHHMLNKKERNWEYVPLILAGMFVASAPDAYGLQGATAMVMR